MMQRYCDYIFEPFRSNAIVEFAAKYAAETRSVFEPEVETASPTEVPAGQPSQAKALPAPLPLSDARSAAAGLSFKAKILDENSNMILEGGERVRIHIDVVNSGPQAVPNIAASITGHEMLTAQFPATTLPVGTLQPGDSKSLDFVATLPQSLQAEQAELSVTVIELATKTGPPSQTLVAALGPRGTKSDDIDQIPTLATAFQQPDHYLVATGLSTYRDPAVPTRKYASLDAQMITRYFQSLGGIPAANMRLLQDRKALRSDLEEALLDWLPARITKNSTVILYFSGQALVTSTGETFLILYDGSTAATSRLYPLKDLEAALSRLKVKQKVFIFDGSILKLDGDRHPKTQGPLWHASTESMVRLIGTSGLGKSLESDTFRHGLFTYSLLRGLRGDADTNRNGEVTLGELTAYVNQEVPSIARTTLHQDQRPQVIPPLRATDRLADLVLTKSPVLTSSQRP
jgi:caspase domain-containing protein